jgi:hypothetical protein
MGLWMFGVDATDDEIDQACVVASRILRDRGISAATAQEAAMDAADLNDAQEETSTPQAAEVIAWYAAEEAACRLLNDLTGEWPSDGALVYTETKDGN